MPEPPTPTSHVLLKYEVWTGASYWIQKQLLRIKTQWLAPNPEELQLVIWLLQNLICYLYMKFKVATKSNNLLIIIIAIDDDHVVVYSIIITLMMLKRNLFSNRYEEYKG